MPIKHVGYKWQKWVAEQAGKVRKRVPPHMRKYPEPPRPYSEKHWGDMSDEQRAHVIEEERLRYLARTAERSSLKRDQKEYQRALRHEHAILRAKRRALAEENARLDREEERIASRLRAEAEEAQWDYEKEMEDYVMGRKPIV